MKHVTYLSLASDKIINESLSVQLFKNLVFLIEVHKKSKLLRGVLVSLASMTVFTTTYVLILPALTLEKNEAAQMPGVDLDEDAL